MKTNLKHIRESAGWKFRNDFADAFGVPERRIKSWETGERQMTLEQAVELANFLNVSLDELAGRDFKKREVISEKSGIKITSGGDNDFAIETSDGEVIVFEVKKQPTSENKYEYTVFGKEIPS